MLKSRKFIVFSLLCILLLLILAFAEFITPHDPYKQDLQNVLSPPSAEHLLGTDNLGRDIFSRILVGGGVTVFSSLSVIAVSVILGTVVGMVSGYFGGIIDTVFMRLGDMLLAFPGIVLALAVATVLGGGINNAVIALLVISWPKFSRLARAEVLKIKEMPYVNVARLNNIGNIKILVRHILPNIYKILFTTAAVDIGAVIMEIAGLSFIGLGVAFPLAEWGSMLSGSISYMATAPWIMLAPSFAIFITVVIFNMLAEAIKENMR